MIFIPRVTNLMGTSIRVNSLNNVSMAMRVCIGGVFSLAIKKVCQTAKLKSLQNATMHKSSEKNVAHTNVNLQ